MANGRFRKKFSLTLLLWASGSFLAYHVGATLTEFTGFAALLLGIFGTQDLIDKNKIKQLTHPE